MEQREEATSSRADPSSLTLPPHPLPSPSVNKAGLNIDQSGEHASSFSPDVVSSQKFGRETDGKAEVE